MHMYESYDLQWLGPIVFPLSFALPTLAYVFYGYYRTGIKTVADVVSFCITGVEAMFAVFCWVQCIANYHNRNMSGGTDACYFQAIYATLYLFTSVMFVGVASVATMHYLNILSAIIISAAVFILGILFALLPYMGAGQYRFPKDFCMCDLEETTFAAAWLVVWSISGILLLLATAACRRESSATVMGKECGSVVVIVSMVIAYLAFFTTPTIIDFIYLSGGDQPGTIYGALAIILHSQQVGNPLLYGVIWRAWMNSNTSVDGCAGSVEKKMEDATAVLGCAKRESQMATGDASRGDCGTCNVAPSC